MGESIAQAASLNVLYAGILVPVLAAVLAALLCLWLRRHPKRQKTTHEMRASGAVDVEVSVTPVDATVTQSHIRSPCDQLLVHSPPSPLPPPSRLPAPDVATCHRLMPNDVVVNPLLSPSTNSSPALTWPSPDIHRSTRGFMNTPLRRTPLDTPLHDTPFDTPLGTPLLEYTTRDMHRSTRVVTPRSGGRRSSPITPFSIPTRGLPAFDYLSSLPELSALLEVAAAFHAEVPSPVEATANAVGPRDVASLVTASLQPTVPEPSSMEAAVAKLAQTRRHLGTFGTQLPTERRDDETALLEEMRRFDRLRTIGFTANDRGDTRTALAAFSEAARIHPSCAMLLSVANMHLKLDQATSAAPIYHFVQASQHASTRERSMAEAKLKLTLAATSAEAQWAISPSPLNHIGCRMSAPPSDRSYRAPFSPAPFNLVATAGAEEPWAISPSPLSHGPRRAVAPPSDRTYRAPFSPASFSPAPFSLAAAALSPQRTVAPRLRSGTSPSRLLVTRLHTDAELRRMLTDDQWVEIEQRCREHESGTLSRPDFVKAVCAICGREKVASLLREELALRGTAQILASPRSAWLGARPPSARVKVLLGPIHRPAAPSAPSAAEPVKQSAPPTTEAAPTVAAGASHQPLPLKRSSSFSRGVARTPEQRLSARFASLEHEPTRFPSSRSLEPGPNSARAQGARSATRLSDAAGTMSPGRQLMRDLQLNLPSAARQRHAATRAAGAAEPSASARSMASSSAAEGEILSVSPMISPTLPRPTAPLAKSNPLVPPLDALFATRFMLGGSCSSRSTHSAREALNEMSPRSGSRASQLHFLHSAELDDPEDASPREPSPHPSQRYVSTTESKSRSDDVHLVIVNSARSVHTTPQGSPRSGSIGLTISNNAPSVASTSLSSARRVFNAGPSACSERPVERPVSPRASPRYLTSAPSPVSVAAITARFNALEAEQCAARTSQRALARTCAASSTVLHATAAPRQVSPTVDFSDPERLSIPTSKIRASIKSVRDNRAASVAVPPSAVISGAGVEA